jgi:hypothetical protein
MRTLLEKPATQVWLNEYGVRKVLAAAQRTTAGQPFVVLADPRDMDFANRAVLNQLSEQFAPAYLAAALGRPVRAGTFRFAITCERYEEIRTLKLRVLVVAEQALTDLFGPADGAAQVEAPGVVLRSRLTTLRGMYDLYLHDKGAPRPVLGQIELGVPG